MAIASRVFTSSHAPRGRLISPFTLYPNPNRQNLAFFEKNLKKISNRPIPAGDDAKAAARNISIPSRRLSYGLLLCRCQTAASIFRASSTEWLTNIGPLCGVALKSSGGFEILYFKPPFSFWKNGSTEGVVKSPFFKDTAVSKEVSPCPFSLLIVHLIYTG